MAAPELAAEALAGQMAASELAAEAHDFSTASLAPKFPPAQPGDFILLKVIGRGAFGKVLQVAHATSGRVYAM